MYQLNLRLLHVERQVRAEHEFDLQSTANIFSFSCLFGVFNMSTSHFFEKKILFFLQNKRFSKSSKLVFHVR